MPPHDLALAQPLASKATRSHVLVHVSLPRLTSRLESSAASPHGAEMQMLWRECRVRTLAEGSNSNVALGRLEPDRPADKWPSVRL